MRKKFGKICKNLLDFLVKIWYFIYVIFNCRATDGVCGFTQREHGRYQPTVWAEIYLNLQVDFCPFVFIFGGRI